MDAVTGNRQLALSSPVVLGAAGLALLGALPFFLATTFTGDDHLFLAFARNVANPLLVFTTDMHGGEFYRPLPMLLWWLVGRGGAFARWPFALLAYLLHLLVSVETGVLVSRMTRDRRVAVVAATFFFAAPFTREAAYWYSASTDLLSVALGIGAILAAVSGGVLRANLLLLGACLSKESAAIVPALAVLAVRVRSPEVGWPAAWKSGLRMIPAVAAALVCRTIVLRGLGGSGDVSATVTGKIAQLAFGISHAIPGEDVFSPGLATLVGLTGWLALLTVVGIRARRSGWASVPLASLIWVALAVAPLFTARWIIGARYFYLAMVGVAWFLAQVLAQAPRLATTIVLAIVGGFGLAQATARHADVRSYEARVATTRRAILAGVAAGHRTFHVAGGIKDIDLAVKEDPRLAAPVHEDLVVLGDVPASFVDLPAARPSRIDFLLARPPLPPSGAYVFGDRRVVGLARRGDDPTLDEVVGRLPDLRFIRLRMAPGGRIVYRDVTEMLNAPADELE